MLPYALSRYQRTALATDERAGYRHFYAAIHDPVEVRYRLAGSSMWAEASPDLPLPLPGQRYEWQSRPGPGDEWSASSYFRIEAAKVS